MRAVSIVACATILIARGLAAESGASVTEEKFLEPFDGDHLAFAALRAAVGEAEGAAHSARALANPALGASRETPGELEQLDLALAWQLPHPARRRHAVAAADAGLAAARAWLEMERAGVRRSMREAFARWATSHATVAALGRWSAELDRLARRERDRAERGEVSGLDARRLALAAGDARGRLARAEAERTEALAAVRGWRAELAPDARPELPPLAAALPAPGEPPLLVALGAELGAATAARELAASVVDMPSLSAGWQRQETSGERIDGATFGVEWSLPLFDRRQGERAAAAARFEAAAARLELSRRELEARRAGALAAYESLRAAALDARAADDSAAVVGAATAAFEAGESSVTDLLDALDAATGAELAALELHAAALAAHRRLDEVGGALRAEAP
jgi:outer membrane protein, heavy metal efflux system